MDDVIQIHDQHYILASSSRIEERTRVLKHGDTFAVFDRFGDILRIGLGEQGIFHEGTRHLSKLQLHIDGVRPLLLSSTSLGANELFVVDLTNADITREPILRRGDLHILRSKVLWKGVCYERLNISNFSLNAVDVVFSVSFGADFADIFEVRGTHRAVHGEHLAPSIEDRNRVVLAYTGLDRQTRRTVVGFDPPPAKLTGEAARYELHLEPHASTAIDVMVLCSEQPDATDGLDYDEALRACTEAAITAVPGRADLVTSNEPFNGWLNRSRADLHMLLTDTPSGPYPFAGVPWYSAPFGRDGIITAFEMLWIDASVARGVLQMLANTQARERSRERDAEPGKILHEQRKGEMAALGEVPFGQYYGSVDSTPLFVMLAGAYYQRTGDRALIETLWPSLKRALSWIDTDGDPDQDGFIEYVGSESGLTNQGWKDSTDSVSHADGSLAEGPVALCEVQGYVYAARLAAAQLADMFGEGELAEEQRQRAQRLKAAFAERFWLPELDTFALGLDGKKSPCRVRSSNAGHCLWTGIALEEHATRVANGLFADDLFSGWGIRTLSSTARRYNPMSYHNGSVWPHDNALIAAGLARYGFQPLARRLLAALFDASTYFDLRRLPELFCGFPRRGDEGPTLYPVACAPQAWAAGAVYMLLEACLGLTVDAPKRMARFVASTLPEPLEHMTIKNLAVDGATLDLRFDRHPHDVGLTVLRRDRHVDVVILK